MNYEVTGISPVNGKKYKHVFNYYKYAKNVAKIYVDAGFSDVDIRKITVRPRRVR